jgi:hypothetical protein
MSHCSIYMRTVHVVFQVRAGCDFMCRVCQDEYQLYFHFFSVDSPELKGLLESLCYTLYDVLRPVVIHINHLETLADLCSILKVTCCIYTTVRCVARQMQSNRVIYTCM